jgi:hypothetical protein
LIEPEGRMLRIEIRCAGAKGSVAPNAPLARTQVEFDVTGQKVYNPCNLASQFQISFLAKFPFFDIVACG